MILTLVIIIGLVIGSFLNVCIFRMQKNESISRPNSHCPNCKHQLKPWENIPVLSYLLLLGKCSNCRTNISVRYPLVELLTALLFSVVYYYFGISVRSILLFNLVSIIIVITFIDIDTQLIPNKLLLASILPIVIFIALTDPGSYLNHLSGSLLLGSIFYFIGYIGKLIYKVESMGMGDVKYAAVIGLLLGWQGGILAFALAFFTAAIILLSMSIFKKITKRQRIPFGPFLSVGCLISLFWGREIINWYAGIYK